MSGIEAEIASRLALASLPGASPAAIEKLLTRFGSGVETWRAVRGGALPDGRWCEQARVIEPDRLLAEHRRAGLAVTAPGAWDWPAAFAHDPAPPIVLVSQGDRTVLDRPIAAVVGTRRASSGGRRVAGAIGRSLARAGATTGSGLALGIDGAVQRAALDAGGAVLGVVASGLDTVYPKRHAELWRAVGERGLLLGEWPLGVAPDKWRFPARNRLLAALARIVVVVESGPAGGSMHTVDAALARDVEVLAVPGPILGPESAGTNRLIAAGASVVCDVDDVVRALGLSTTPPVRTGGPAVPATDPDRWLLAALDAGAATLHELAAATDVPAGDVAVVVARLEASGSVVRRNGRYERTAW